MSLQTMPSALVSIDSMFEKLCNAIPFSFATVISTLPRGGLQVVQQHQLPDGWARAYSRTGHLHDRISLHAMNNESARRADDAFGGNWHRSSFFGEMMPPHRIQHGVAVGLDSPVLPGYPGALHLYRTAELGAFDDAALNRLTHFSGELILSLHKTHHARSSDWDYLPEGIRHDAPNKVFLFNSDAEILTGAAALADLDVKLRDSIVAQAQIELNHLKDGKKTSDRVLIPDSQGDHWAFRVGGYADYPAVGGRAVYLSMQPQVADWSSLQSTDFAADPEIARLVNAISFMTREYHRGPTMDFLVRIHNCAVRQLCTGHVRRDIPAIAPASSAAFFNAMTTPASAPSAI